MKQIFIILFLLSLIGSSAWAAELGKTAPTYQQDMIELGSYVFGLNQERAKKVPDTDNIKFLSDSMLKVVDRLGGNKDAPGFHDNFKELRDKIKDLKKAKGSEETLKLAGEVVNTCGNCHGAQNVVKQNKKI